MTFDSDFVLALALLILAVSVAVIDSRPRKVKR